MSDELHIVIDPRYADQIQKDPAKLDALIACADPDGGFRAFLNHWHFRDQNTGQIRILGEVLWEGQLRFVEAVSQTKHLYALKARKLGYTTIECAWDAYCARFGVPNGRVHLFSRRQGAAQELLEAVVFGLDRLPEYMRLPKTKDTNEEVRYGAGPDDERIIKAYPADEDTAVEANCTHGHVDEWARMGNPQRVWQAIEPGMAGSCHIITTGMGPANYTADFWRKSMVGDTTFRAHFQPALSRPDRNEAWLDQKRRSMDERSFRLEYAMTWEDALFGGGEFIFGSESLNNAAIDALGPQEPQLGRKYVKAWDIGRHKDAAVGIVLDVTEDVVDVVYYARYREMTYPDLQARIEGVHIAYPGMTFIEKNAAGEAVLENLNIPDDEVEGFSMTKSSKPRILKELIIGFQKQVLKYDPRAWPQLDAELRGYQLPDDQIVQDSVMTLAIAYDKVESAYIRGKMKRILTW